MRFHLGFTAGEDHAAWIFPALLVLVALFLDDLLDLLPLLLCILLTRWLRAELGFCRGRVRIRRRWRMSMERWALDGGAEAGLAATGSR